jgi:hypothetical protein
MTTTSARVTGRDGRDLTQLRLETEVRYKATVDLVAYFTKITDPRMRAFYWKVDLTEWSEGEEYARPLAYLYGELDDETGGLGSLVHWDDSDGWDLRGKAWGEEDFRALVAAVPWLAPPEDLTDEERAQREEDEKRLPGPHDVPMFDIPEGKTA